MFVFDNFIIEIFFLVKQQVLKTLDIMIIRRKYEKVILFYILFIFISQFFIEWYRTNDKSKTKI